jgi:signal peptidase I
LSKKDSEQKGGFFGETFSVIVQALILALILRTFLFQPFSIPSGSMKPSLLVGDYLFVSKFSYGYSKFSIPFSPDLFNGRIWGGEPKRGDIAVFKYPPNPQIDYIKRVVGRVIKSRCVKGFCTLTVRRLSVNDHLKITLMMKPELALYQFSLRPCPMV